MAALTLERMRRRAIARRAAITLALGLVVGLGSGSYHASEEVREAADSVEHANAVLGCLERVRLDTALAGSAARGCAIAPGGELTGSFRASLGAARTELETLRTLTADNPTQVSQVARFADAVEARLHSLAASMALITDAPRADLAPPVMAVLGVVPGAGYDAAADVVASTERDLLVVRRARAEHAAATTRTMSVAGTSVALLVLGLLFVQVERENQKRATSEAALRAENAERVRVNAELETAYAATRAAEAELDRFFVMSLDMLAIANTDGYFKRLSPAFRSLGYDDDELLSRPFLDFVHPDDRDATIAEVAKLATGVSTVRFENRYRCKDGSYRWLAWNTAPTPAGVLYATARDVTDAMLTSAALQRAKDDTEAANKELEAFSYSVSHDLRSPLRAIDGFAAALDEDYAAQLDPQARDYLRRIRAAAKHMAALIDDLLDLARVGRADLQVEPVQIRPLVEAVVTALQQREPDRKVEVVVEPGAQVWADERLLRVVLDNLIGNAWKFTGKTAAPRIEVGVTRRGSDSVLCVRDNGAGFDPAYASRLFGVFQRLHSKTDFEGTGIGLATIQRIARRHGGNAEAEGAVGLGATLRVRFPEGMDAIGGTTSMEGPAVELASTRPASVPS